MLYLLVSFLPNVFSWKLWDNFCSFLFPSSTRTLLSFQNGLLLKWTTQFYSTSHNKSSFKPGWAWFVVIIRNIRAQFSSSQANFSKKWGKRGYNGPPPPSTSNLIMLKQFSPTIAPLYTLQAIWLSLHTLQNLMDYVHSTSSSSLCDSRRKEAVLLY